MMIHRRSLIASAAATAVLPNIAASQNSPRWQRRADMPWATQEVYCAVLDGKIYVAGGLIRDAIATRINDRVGIYDPATDSWTEGPRLPQPRHHPMMAAARGRVWAFGGYDRREGGEWTSMTDVWALDDGLWHPVTQMPQPLAETVGVTVGDRVHLVTGRSPKDKNGGWYDQVDVTTHMIFDASDATWHTARPAPLARNSAAASVHGHHIYVAGGRMVEGGRGTGRLDRYDTETDSWVTLAPIPASPASGEQVGGGLAMATVGDRLVAFGGEWLTRPGGVFTETWIYDIAADRWARGPDMGVPRHGLAGCAVDGVVYALAGGEVYSGGKASGVVEALRL